MTSVEIYSRAGAERAFAPATVGATIADHSARLAVLEAAHPGAAPLTLGALVPRPARSAATAPVLGFITDGFFGAAPGLAARALGAAPTASAQPSTGWAAGAPQNFSAPQRIDAVLDAHPAALVVVGSFEDAAANPPSSPDKIAQSINTLVTRVRNRAPALPILVIGPQPTSEYLMYAGAAHTCAKAVREGAARAGGEGNGVHFADWLGLAASPAIKWDPASSPSRTFRSGEVICYDGVNYRVSETTWTPEALDPYRAQFAASAPVERASVVLSGTGAAKPPPATGTGTRGLWLKADERALISGAGGEDAYGVELATRIVEGLSSLREWILAKGPAVVGPYVAPPPPPPPPPPPARPAIPGAGADLRATKWGVKWGALSTTALSAVLAAAPAAPFSIALPVRRSGDTAEDRFVVSTPNKIVPKAGGAGPQINQSTIAQLKAVEDVNGTIATLGEALALIKTPARKPIVLECMDTSTDNTAQYFNYDETMMRYLLAVDAKAPGSVVIATGPNLNAARAKAKADPALAPFRRLVVKPAGPWTADDIRAIKDADAIACRPADSSRPEVLAAIKALVPAPGLWFAGMVTAEDVKVARAAAKTAALAIEGWLADGPAAAAEIAAKTQPEQP